MEKIPDGALKGEFTVDAQGTKVHFSKGNLTYSVTTPKWAFYEHQYDCASRYDANLISLFTWGYNANTSVVPDGLDYVHGHITDGELDVLFDPNEDWGSQIGDGNTRRTLSTLEWQYLFNTRVMANGGVRYENLTSSGITVESVLFKGVVLFPDDFTEQETWKTKYTTWEAINNAELVFLPAAGSREGSDVEGIGQEGCYWSSCALFKEAAFSVWFYDSNVNPHNPGYRDFGFSVRLITECQ